MVRLVDSQWLEPVTLLSVLVKVTSQETLVLVLTVKVVLFVVSVLSAADVANERHHHQHRPVTSRSS